MFTKKPTQGSALISALFIMTLVTIAATAMSTRLQLDIYRTQLALNQDTLYLASQAVTGWAMGQLSARHPHFVAQNDSGVVRLFPKQYQHLSPKVVTEGYLIDLQSKYNINNTSDKHYHALFHALMNRVLKNTQTSEQKTILQSISQWMQPEHPRQKKEDSFNPNKRPALDVHLMNHVSELQLIHGINTKTYKALYPYVTALPEKTAINLNTASKKLLLSLSEGTSASLIETLLNMRDNKEIKSIEDIRLILEKMAIPMTLVTLESTYFLSVANMSLNHQHLTVYVLLKRETINRGKVRVHIMHESLNTF
jgi:general secretion pathway protein K